MQERPNPGETPREPRAPSGGKPGGDAQRTDSPKHDDWLLDEAIAETFPASDPISPSTSTDKG